MNPKAKKLYIGLGIILGMMVIGLVFVFIQKNQYKIDLLEKGIRTEAQVINKYHVRDVKGRIKKSFIELAIFEDTTAVVNQHNNKAKKEPANINDKIDDLFDNFGSKKSPMGEYKTKTILVDLSQYDGFKVGSTKTFVYLKDQVDKGMLLTKLE